MDKPKDKVEVMTKKRNGARVSTSDKEITGK